MAYLERSYGAAPLRSLISVPPGDPPKGGWPVLVFLHGRNECAPLDIQIALTRHGPLNPASAVTARNRFLIVAPQLPAPGGDVWASKYADAVRRLAADATQEFGGDPTKVYLTGFSYGGNGVLEIGSGQPDVWAALWPVDPPRATAPSGNQPIWVSAGEYSRGNRRGDFVGLHTLDKDTSPHSDRVYHDEGLPHVPTARAAYENTVIYKWLEKHQLRERPNVPGVSSSTGRV